ncbi:MAG TPA: DUF5069 domain-containing protein [Candidatus Baltobacteraceae bacterium]|jgi:hypothetical protein|nr:DUF5069 domain-containing protein [Candidatus Baltobacteraceae bacterium]
MEALDLTQKAPRGPREQLGDLDLLMMARTVDKIRATLPGGNIGPYQISGFSSSLLNALEIPEADLRAVIAKASDESEIVRWIRGRTAPSTYAEYNEKLAGRTIADRIGDERWAARYPIAKTLPPETPLIDMLAADDDDMFAKR